MNVGIDIVDIDRLSKLVKNKKFVKRIFSEDEITYCNSRKNSIQHYAVRFAAKEAVWKALGKKKIGLKDISISNNSYGKPEIVLNKLKDLEKKFSVSLSHSRNYAVAVAILEERKLRTSNCT